MNDEKREDRFYSEEKMHPNGKWVIFLNSLWCDSKNQSVLKFTDNKAYPVLDLKEEDVYGHKIKTVDDTGKEGWVSDQCFISTDANYELIKENSFEEIKQKMEAIRQEESKMKEMEHHYFPRFISDQLICKIGKVFPEYASPDQNEILKLLNSHVPTRTFAWFHNRLIIDGAETNISFDAIKHAFDGLNAITTQTIANKIIAKLIAKKVKKLF